MQHAPRFLKLVDEARAHIQETNVDEVKRRMDRGEIRAGGCPRGK